MQKTDFYPNFEKWGHAARLFEAFAQEARNLSPDDKKHTQEALLKASSESTTLLKSLCDFWYQESPLTAGFDSTKNNYDQKIMEAESGRQIILSLLPSDIRNCLEEDNHILVAALKQFSSGDVTLKKLSGRLHAYLDWLEAAIFWTHLGASQTA